jgi:hypothetical protein
MRQRGSRSEEIGLSSSQDGTTGACASGFRPNRWKEGWLHIEGMEVSSLTQETTSSKSVM